MKIRAKMNDVIRREQEKLQSNENYVNNMKEYQKFKEMGLVVKKEYDISRPDNIGYSRFGHIAY